MILHIATATALLFAWLWLIFVLTQPLVAVYMWLPIPDPNLVTAWRDYQVRLIAAQALREFAAALPRRHRPHRHRPCAAILDRHHNRPR